MGEFLIIVGGCGDVNNKHLYEVIKEVVVYCITALPRAMHDVTWSAYKARESDREQ